MECQDFTITNNYVLFPDSSINLIILKYPRLEINPRVFHCAGQKKTKQKKLCRSKLFSRCCGITGTTPAGFLGRAEDEAALINRITPLPGGGRTSTVYQVPGWRVDSRDTWFTV